jgi:cytochrome b subunit of formate dehydrogenase
MATASLTAYDVFMRIVATAIALCGVGMAVCGVGLFWGPLRHVLVAPVIVAIGMMAYIAGRALWRTVDHDLRARS